MRFIIFLILANVFAFAIDYTWVHATYTTSQATFDAQSCPAGQYWIQTSTTSDARDSGYYKSGNTLTIANQGNFYSFSSSYPIIKKRALSRLAQPGDYYYDSNRFYVYSTYYIYNCTTHDPCPTGLTWDIAIQSCSSNCAANQVFITNSLLDNYQQCFNACGSLDNYTCAGSSMGDIVANTGISNVVECCTIKTDVSESQCKNAAAQGYTWLCNADDGVMKFLDFVLNTSNSGHCACHNVMQTSAAFELLNFASNFSFKGVIKSIPNLFKNISSYMKGKDGNMPQFVFKNKNDEAVADAFFEYLKQNYADLKSQYPNGFPKNTNMDLGDAEIVSTSSGLSFKPEFTASPSATQDGKVTLSSDGLASNFQKSGVDPNVLNSALPTPQFDYTPDLYISAMLTATKTKWELPPVSEIGQAVTVSVPVPTRISGVTKSVRQYPAIVEEITPTRVVYRTLTSSEHGTTGYKIVRNTESDGSTAVHVVSDSPIIHNSSTENIYGTFNNSYSYRISTDGRIQNQTTGSTTVNLNNGTTYTNPITSDSTTNNINYNYNTTQQNVDGLLNYQPQKISNDIDTSISKFSLLENDVFSFAGEMFNNLSEVKGEFEQLFNTLQNDKPTLATRTGSCAVVLNWHGNTYTGDLCSSIAPAKPLIASLLSMLGVFSVLLWAFGGSRD